MTPRPPLGSTAAQTPRGPPDGGGRRPRQCRQWPPEHPGGDEGGGEGPLRLAPTTAGAMRRVGKRNRRGNQPASMDPAERKRMQQEMFAGPAEVEEDEEPPTNTRALAIVPQGALVVRQAPETRDAKLEAMVEDMYENYFRRNDCPPTRQDLWDYLHDLYNSTRREDWSTARFLGQGTNLPAFYAKAWSFDPPYEGVVQAKGWALNRRCKCMGSPPMSVRETRAGPWYACCHLRSLDPYRKWVTGCSSYENVNPKDVNLYTHADMEQEQTPPASEGEEHHFRLEPARASEVVEDESPEPSSASKRESEEVAIPVTPVKPKTKRRKRLKRLIQESERESEEAPNTVTPVKRKPKRLKRRVKKKSVSDPSYKSDEEANEWEASAVVNTDD